MLQCEKKKELISQYAVNEGDTGSADVQVALLTERISALTAHLKANSHDHNTRMGLLRLTARRRKFLTYLERTEGQRYRALVARLGLRR